MLKPNSNAEIEPAAAINGLMFCEDLANKFFIFCDNMADILSWPLEIMVNYVRSER